MTDSSARVWFDTEFIEDGKTIDLVSIGLIREDGEAYYAEVAGVDCSRADPWLHANVFPHLRGGDALKSREQIAREIVAFVGPKPEFWAYFADYDWVALCQLYGRMIDLPKGWPMFCRDLKQEAGDRPLIEQTSIEHHALADAVWTREAHLALSAAPAPDKAEPTPPASWPPELETTAEERRQLLDFIVEQDLEHNVMWGIAFQVLRDFDRLLRSHDEVRRALQSAITIADEIRDKWDADEDAKVGKLLIALSGNLPGYRKDIDAVHRVLSAAPAPDKAECPPPASWPAELVAEARKVRSNLLFWQDRCLNEPTHLLQTFILEGAGARHVSTELLEAAILIDKLLHSAPPASDVRQEALSEFGKHRNWELTYVYEEDGDDYWAVHERSGPVNDREWDLIGQGDTPLAAIAAAIRSLAGKSGGGDA